MVTRWVGQRDWRVIVQWVQNFSMGWGKNSGDGWCCGLQKNVKVQEKKKKNVKVLNAIALQTLNMIKMVHFILYVVYNLKKEVLRTRNA